MSAGKFVRAIRMGIVALAAIAVVQPVLATAAAADPLPPGRVTISAASCTAYTETYVPLAGDYIRRPSIGQGTGSLNCVLGVGNQSSAVRVLQEDLNRAYNSGLQVDGIYGPATKTAVANAQRHIGGISVDGVYGPQTCNRMRWYFLYVLPNSFVANMFDCS